MTYSKELIDEVKELYPNSYEIHGHAERGSVFLGRYLDDGASSSISIKEVLNASSLSELQSKARLMQRKVDLYKKWSEQNRQQPF